MANDISNPTIKKKFRKNIIIGNIKIGKNVLVGAGTYIIPRRKNKGIKIGDNVSIGVNSVISRSIASNVLVFNKNLHEIKILPIKKKINFSKVKF